MWGPFAVDHQCWWVIDIGALCARVGGWGVDGFHVDIDIHIVGLSMERTAEGMDVGVKGVVDIFQSLVNVKDHARRRTDALRRVLLIKPSQTSFSLVLSLPWLARMPVMLSSMEHRLLSPPTASRGQQFPLLKGLFALAVCRRAHPVATAHIFNDPVPTLEAGIFDQ